ncbi:MAG: hypothetical protein ACXAEB_08315 [Candidatus Thorarchaeota archaeon]
MILKRWYDWRVDWTMLLEVALGLIMPLLLLYIIAVLARAGESECVEGLNECLEEWEAIKKEWD